MSTTITPAQAAAFRKLGHPVRMDILTTLATRDKPLSPNAFRNLKIDDLLKDNPRMKRPAAVKIVDAQGYTLGAVAYHFRKLHEGSKRSEPRMIVQAEETRVRGAVEHHYTIGAKGRRAIAPMLAGAAS